LCLVTRTDECRRSQTNIAEFGCPMLSIVKRVPPVRLDDRVNRPNRVRLSIPGTPASEGRREKGAPTPRRLLSHGPRL
jgi:hypothetical protein